MKKEKTILSFWRFAYHLQSEICDSSSPDAEVSTKLIKKFISFIIIFILINLLYCLVPQLSSAESNNLNPKKDNIRVGIFHYYPIVFEKNGEPTGFHLELLKKVAKEEGWDLEFKFLGSMSNVIKGLESQTLDLGMGLVPTSERQEFLEFTTESNALVKGQVFVQSDRRDITSFADLDKKTVAYVNMDTVGENFIAICKKRGVLPDLIRTNSFDDLSAAVIGGDVDAGVFNSIQGEKYASVYSGIRATPIVFKPMEVQYAVPKGQNHFIIETLDRNLRKWKTSQDSFYQRLEKQFLSGEMQVNEMTTRELLIGLCICLLFILFGIMVGDGMAKKSEEESPEYSRAYIRDIIVFTISIGLVFWVVDSLMLWYIFNDERQLTFLELAVTKVPLENIYTRAMFFLVCCFFGMFLAKYIKRYEEVYHLLHISVDRFERLTDNAKDVIFHMSLPDGKYEFVNKASSQVFGYSPEEFYNQPMLIKELIGPDSSTYFRAKWEKLLAGQIPPDYEYQIIHKDGGVRWVNQRNTVYFDDSGAPCALEGIVTDVTRQRSSDDS